MVKKSNYEIIKFIDGELELEVTVSPNEETIWMSQNEIAQLFGKSKSTINEHIKNILKYELNESDVVRKFGKTEFSNIKTKPINMYNLDVILMVGYKVNSKKGILFRKWVSTILKEYLLRGYVINEHRTTISNENLHNLIFTVNEIQANQINLNKRLNIIEEKILTKEHKINKLFYNGEFYDAYTLIQSIFESASSEIIIIDNYVDRSILDRLIIKKNNVKTIIYTNINTSKLIGTDINSFNKQYGGLDVKYTTKVHDRYIIIDRTKLYHLGHSIKDLGKKIFSISESDSAIIQDLINNI